MIVRERKKIGAPPVIHSPSVLDPKAEVGSDTMIGAFCFVAAGARIGAGTRIQSHTAVWHGVTLEEDVFVGPAATFTNVRHPRADFPRSPDWDPTVVERGATLGANSVVVAPVRIGTRAVVAAGAVVTRDVPPHAIVAGAPARIIGWACTCGETIARGARTPKSASCGRCERHFVRSKNGVLSDASAPRAARSLPRTRSSTRARTPGSRTRRPSSR